MTFSNLIRVHRKKVLFNITLYYNRLAEYHLHLKCYFVILTLLVNALSILTL